MKKLLLSLMVSASVLLTACGNPDNDFDDAHVGTYEGADGAYGDLSVSYDGEEKFAVSESEAEEPSEADGNIEYNADSILMPDDAAKRPIMSVSDAEKFAESKSDYEAKVISDSETDEYSENESEPEEAFDDYSDDTYVEYYFRTKNQLTQHFQKHGGEFGDEFGYETAEDYERGASDVINSHDALYKTEAEDGDGVYYIEGTNEFVILSTDGYIRTYFRPTAGKSYFDRQ